MALPGRLSIMLLRCIISLPFDMPFLSMKKATRIMLNTFFAITGVLLSISICFRLFRILERERDFSDLREIFERERELERRWNGLKGKRGQGGIYIYICDSSEEKEGMTNVLVLHLNQPTLEYKQWVHRYFSFIIII